MNASPRNDLSICKSHHARPPQCDSFPPRFSDAEQKTQQAQAIRDSRRARGHWRYLVAIVHARRTGVREMQLVPVSNALAAVFLFARLPSIALAHLTDCWSRRLGMFRTTRLSRFADDDHRGILGLAAGVECIAGREKASREDCRFSPESVVALRKLVTSLRKIRLSAS